MLENFLLLPLLSSPGLRQIFLDSGKKVKSGHWQRQIGLLPACCDLLTLLVSVQLAVAILTDVFKLDAALESSAGHVNVDFFVPLLDKNCSARLELDPDSRQLIVTFAA